MKAFRSPDGTHWGVEITSPSSSNAMVLFHHPNGQTSQLDRYAWFLSHGPQANNVTARLDPKKDVLDLLTERDIALLFRRSFPVSTAAGPDNVATGRASQSHESGANGSPDSENAHRPEATRGGWLPGTLRRSTTRTGS